RGMYEEVVKKKNGKIVTSAFTIAEVAHIATERERRRRFSTVDEDLRDIWLDPNVLIVEASRFIMEIARELIRVNLTNDFSLKGGDAVHLATAKFMENNGLLVQEVNSYNRWEKYAPLIGIRICEPHFNPEAEQLNLIDMLDQLDEDF